MKNISSLFSIPLKSPAYIELNTPYIIEFTSTSPKQGKHPARYGLVDVGQVWDDFVVV